MYLGKSFQTIEIEQIVFVTLKNKHLNVLLGKSVQEKQLDCVFFFINI
jgi:hypothetical protein